MKTLITVNIGLNDSDNLPINVHTVIANLSSYGLECLASRVFDSPAGNEKCLVASCKFQGDEQDLHNQIYGLSTTLRQDCIAVWHGGKGELIGPNYASWGEFNPAFFVGLSGLTLAEVDKPCGVPTGDGHTLGSFVSYLRNTLIPDLKESGFEATAEDFENLLTLTGN